MASLTDAFTPIVPPAKMSDASAHNYGTGVELLRHARTLDANHPDRSKFMLESARLRNGIKVDANDSALKNLVDPYEISHDNIKNRRQTHIDQESRFKKEVLNDS